MARLRDISQVRGPAYRFGYSNIPRWRLFSCYAFSDARPSGLLTMKAVLVESTRHRRSFEVTCSDSTYSVAYAGGMAGNESVSVNGEVVAQQQRNAKGDCVNLGREQRA
jgi:hypothetical protein